MLPFSNFGPLFVPQSFKVDFAFTHNSTAAYAAYIGRLVIYQHMGNYRLLLPGNERGGGVK